MTPGRMNSETNPSGPPTTEPPDFVFIQSLFQRLLQKHLSRVNNLKCMVDDREKTLIPAIHDCHVMNR